MCFGTTRCDMIEDVCVRWYRKSAKTKIGLCCVVGRKIRAKIGSVQVYVVVA